MFSPYGTIVSEDFLWHTRGPKRGEPRGYAFVQYRTVEVSFSPSHSHISICMQFLKYNFKVSMQEAKLAKEKVHGKLVYGRHLVVRLASEKILLECTESSDKAIEAKRPGLPGTCSGQMTRSAKIAAIKNKLKDMEDESHETKRLKQTEGGPPVNNRPSL